jgi:hypothetical protein
MRYLARIHDGETEKSSAAEPQKKQNTDHTAGTDMNDADDGPESGLVLSVFSARSVVGTQKILMASEEMKK